MSVYASAESNACIVVSTETPQTTTSVGAKSQILSSVAPPRKKNLVTFFSQGHVLGPWKPMFY